MLRSHSLTIKLFSIKRGMRGILIVTMHISRPPHIDLVRVTSAGETSSRIDL